MRCLLLITALPWSGLPLIAIEAYLIQV